MGNLWWVETIGFILLVMGAWRLIWRLPLFLGLLGANKFGTAKGDQVETNKANIEAMKKGVPLAILLIVVGGLLVLFF